MDARAIGRIEEILSQAARDGRSQLLEGEVYRILAAIRIPTPRFVTVPAGAPRDEIERAATELLTAEGPGRPSGVVVKIQSPQILHKTEAGGIAFAEAEPGAITEAAAQVLDRVRSRAPGAQLTGLLLSERIDYPANLPGAEILLSLRQDGAMGPIVVFGIGGLLTEWFGKLAPNQTTCILSARDPVFDSQDMPSRLLRGPAFTFLFEPSRLHKRQPLDRSEFWTMLRGWADLARTFGSARGADGTVIAELEINPMAVRPDSGVALPTAIDGIGRIGVRPEAPRTRRIDKVKNLLEPRSVAVIGASGRSMNAGRIILQNLRTAEGVAYGHIYGVHPKEKAIDTIPCFPSVQALPERVDLAVVCVPAEAARDAVRDIVRERKAHSIILIPGGFAETGSHGLANEIVAHLEEGRGHDDGGPVLLGGNCLGIVSKRQYNTFFLPQYKLPFHDAPGDNLVAISQSGAYLVTLTSNLDGVIFPKASISYGNQMDLTVADFLNYYLEDPDVQVLACYIEGFQPGDGWRCAQAIRKHRERGRSVVVFKAGKTALGAQAAASHTASLAGDYAATRALLQDAGAVVAETLNQFEDFTKVFTMLYGRLPTGRRVGIISNAGFECSAAMDALYDLQFAHFSDETKARLKSCLPGIAHADNAVDATPMATTPQFVQAVEAILADPNVDAVIVSAVPVTQALDDLPPDPDGTHPENIYSMSSLPQELIRVFRASEKPLVVAVDSGRIYDDCVRLLQRAGVPVFRKIDRATRALSRYCSARL